MPIQFVKHALPHCWQGCGEMGCLVRAGGSINRISHRGEESGRNHHIAATNLLTQQPHSCECILRINFALAT